MKQLPTPPAPGKPVSATLIRQLIDAIRERTILPGRNISMKRGPNGTVLNVNSPAVPAAQPFEYPWMLKKVKEEGDDEAVLRWCNCHIQVGLNYIDFTHDGDDISGREVTEDGTYYFEFDMTDDTVEIKHVGLDGEVPGHDYESRKFNFYIGKVEDGKQSGRILSVPVIYKYL